MVHIVCDELFQLLERDLELLLVPDHCNGTNIVWVVGEKRAAYQPGCHVSETIRSLVSAERAAAWGAA